MHAVAVIAKVLALGRRFLGCERGGPAVEFGFAALVLFLFTFGMIEVGLIMFCSSAVEGGLRDAARWGITGQEPASGTRQQQILSILDQRTMGLVDVNAATITFKAYDSFDNVGQPEPYTDANANQQYDEGETYDDVNGNGHWDADRGKDGVGGSGEVVLYKIVYDWDLLTPIISRIIGGDTGKIRMSASVVVRNEPWQLVGG